MCRILFSKRYNLRLSFWGETLNLRWLYRRKIVNLSESDKRGISLDKVVLLSRFSPSLQITSLSVAIVKHLK
jgi:hypothetical protein